MTTSLWGIIYALFIFLFILILSITNRKTFTSFKKDLLKFIILFGTSIFTWNYLFSNKIFRSTYFVIWIKRFNNLDNDSSAIARYSFNDFFNKIDTFSFKQMLFGHGATTSLGTFQDLLGANGFSFLLYSVGFLGIIILFAILFCALNKYKNKTFQNLFKIYFLNLSFIIFISSSYPMFTYTLFWAWLATMINSSQFYLSKSK